MTTLEACMAGVLLSFSDLTTLNYCTGLRSPLRAFLQITACVI